MSINIQQTPVIVTAHARSCSSTYAIIFACPRANLVLPKRGVVESGKNQLRGHSMAWWRVTQGLRKTSLEIACTQTFNWSQLKSIKLDWTGVLVNLSNMLGIKCCWENLLVERRLHKLEACYGKIHSSVVHISKMRSNILRSFLQFFHFFVMLLENFCFHSPVQQRMI